MVLLLDNINTKRFNSLNAQSNLVNHCVSLQTDLQKA